MIWRADRILVEMFELEWMLMHTSSTGSDDYELIIFPFDPNIFSSGVVG